MRCVSCVRCKARKFPPYTHIETHGPLTTCKHTRAQGWARYDEKVDLWSLGVVVFELWHPFATGAAGKLDRRGGRAGWEGGRAGGSRSNHSSAAPTPRPHDAARVHQRLDPSPTPHLHPTPC